MQAWLLALILSLAPTPYRVPSMPETLAAYRARMATVAADLAAQVRSPAEGALMVALAYRESGFALDADVGPCDRRIGPGRCDGGRSVSMWQVMIANGVTAEGWGRAELFASRPHAIHEALRRVRRSVGACRGGGPDAALDAYAGGKCSAEGEAARERGRERLELARRLLAGHPPPSPSEL